MGYLSHIVGFALIYEVEMKTNDKRPTPEDLAGTPIVVEGREDLTVRPRRAGSVRITDDSSRQDESNGSYRPTPEDLAGITIIVEGREDLTVRPRRSTLADRYKGKPNPPPDSQNDQRPSTT